MSSPIVVANIRGRRAKCHPLRYVNSNAHASQAEDYCPSRQRCEFQRVDQQLRWSTLRNVRRHHFPGGIITVGAICTDEHALTCFRFVSLEPPIEPREVDAREVTAIGLE